MSLNAEERDAVVQVRIEKSISTIEEAKGNASMCFWPAAANRLYYAAYYAVSALLIANKDTAQTHQGVILVFGLKFIKTGIVSREMGDLYSKLYANRMTGDYDDTYTLKAEDVLPIIEPTERFIQTINALTQQLQESAFTKDA